MELKCSRCDGEGIDSTTGITCIGCHGTGTITAGWYQAVEIQQEVMQDKLNDIMNKCNDIFEKVNE